MHRIESLDREFAALVRCWSPGERVAVIRAVCLELVAAHPTLPPDLLAVARQTEAATGEQRRSAERLANELDEHYLDLLEAEGDSTQAFALARAAAAIVLAPAGDAVEDCLYEAQFALGLERLKVVANAAAVTSSNQSHPKSTKP